MSDTEETRPLINSNTLDQPPVYSFYQFSDDHPAVSGILQNRPWLLLRRCNPSNTDDRVRNISSNAENNPNTNPNIYTATYVWQVAAS